MTGSMKVEINVHSKIRALAYLPGEVPCVISGEESSVQLRHPTNHMMGEPIGSSADILAVAVSKDGKRIVTGATDGFTIWSRVHGGGSPLRVAYHPINGVRSIDISSDSKWVVTGSDARTTDIWDVSTGERHPKLGQLKQEYNVVLVRFCPCGERIAIATLFGSVRIYSTDSWRQLLTIPVSVMCSPSLPTITLAWFPNRPQIFVASQGQIKCLKSDDGSIVFQWALRGVKHPSSVTLSPNSKLIAYSINDTVIVRDVVVGKQIGDALRHNANVSCIAFSPGSDHLVVGADTELTTWDLRKLFTKAVYSPDNTVGPVESCTLHGQDPTPKPPPSTFSLPLMNIINDAVKPWLHGYFKSADEVLSTEIDSPAFSDKHDSDTPANRALIRGHLKDWEMALKDAEQSLSIQPSAIGHIAKAIALIHIHDNSHELIKQEVDAIDAFYSDKHKILLEIVQRILLSMSGDDKQVAHVIKLSKNHEYQKLLLLVQANLYLCHNDFEHALDAVKGACVPTIFPHEETPEMWSISFIFGWKFSGLVIQIQQRKCQFLLDDGSAKAAELYLEISQAYHREIALHVELSDWFREFERDCLKRLQDLGDKALHESGDYKKAVEQYTAVKCLIRDLEPKYELLLKRSDAYVKLGPENWDNALKDANEAIGIKPYAPWGYERQHAVLHAKQQYHEAAESLDKLVQYFMSSEDPRSLDLRSQGVKPNEASKMIVEVVSDVLSQARPDVLINTKSGQLCNKQKQMEVFKADPMCKEILLQPLNTDACWNRWKDDIKKYFRYSMLSHTWEDVGEPGFRCLENKSINHLDGSVPSRKLQTFCKKSCVTYGFRWAWSDTCCINKDEKEVLNRSLRSMYTWYSESSLTMVHLKGVFRKLGVDSDTFLNILDAILKDFVDCRWNKRAWTLQEYFASRVIHFYTEDWEPYLPIGQSPEKLTNHKTFNAIKQGMELVTGVDAESLAALKPGTRDAREKLRLAAARKATRKEDIAYSLLGIFEITMETIYGDDEVPRALGRLLGALLTNSSDVTILAWKGQPSKYNTCLPAEITVYKEPESYYIPHRIEEADFAPSIPSMLSSLSSESLNAALKLYDNLIHSQPSKIINGRLELSCIRFPVNSIRLGTDSQSYIATVQLLGEVKINTSDELSSLRSMIIVHPWFKRLLSSDNPMEDSAKRESALRFLAALRQPFGALLLALNNPGDYERIATDSLITVQIPETVSPEELLKNIRVLYIR